MKRRTLYGRGDLLPKRPTSKILPAITDKHELRLKSKLIDIVIDKVPNVELKEVKNQPVVRMTKHGMVKFG